MEAWQEGWGLTEQATRWTRSVVWSRAFKVPLGEQGHGLALVPFADLLDHDPSAHIAWHAGFTGSDDFQMVTFSPIAKAGAASHLASSRPSQPDMTVHITVVFQSH